MTLAREPIDVSAVIINFNGGRKLLSYVDALIGQTVALCEIVIVDNGSTDDSLSAVEQGYPDVQPGRPCWPGNAEDHHCGSLPD